MLKQKSPTLQKIVVESTSNQKISALVPLLLDMYDTSESPERTNIALEGLTNIPDERALDAYLDGLTHQNEELRTASQKALRTISEQVREEVFQIVREESLPEQVIQQLATVFQKLVPVRSWQIVGPFPRNQSRPFKFGQWSPDQTFDGENDNVSWTKAKADNQHGKINLEQVLENIDHASAFARATITVEEATTTEFILGSDDGLRVWVNGEKVFEDMGTRGWAPDQFQVPVSLEEGRNEIVCKIEENTGSWAFSVKYFQQNLMEKIKNQE